MIIISKRVQIGETKRVVIRVCVSLGGSRALFTGSTSTSFSKYNFQLGSHDTIHTFKNYFAIVFSVFSDNN